MINSGEIKMRIVPIALPNQLILLIGVLSLIIGCNIFGSDNGCPDDPPDFKPEEGYYVYGENMESIPRKRSRNYVSILFKGSMSHEEIEALLSDYHLEVETWWGELEGGLHLVARCLCKPAESYYTTYGDTSRTVLGNRSDVEFAVPVMLGKSNSRVVLTDIIDMRFEDSISSQRRKTIIDSLKQTDNLVDGDNLLFDYRLRTTKVSPAYAFKLVKEYNFVRGIRRAFVYSEMKTRLTGS